MPPQSDDANLPVEFQTALLRRDIAELRRDIDAHMQKPHLDEPLARELCREIISKERQGESGIKDNVMRLVAFAVSIGTAIFVIRGGR